LLFFVKKELARERKRELKTVQPMLKKRRRFLPRAIFPVVLLGLVLPANAGLFSKKNSQSRGPALLDWDPSVRSAGMGGSFVGVADDAGALFWNPAGLGQVPRGELALSYADGSDGAPR
jgi:hypothetical protein